MSASQAETDRMLIGARGAAARADAYGEIAGNKMRYADTVMGTVLNVASDWLNTGRDWASMNARQGLQQPGGTTVSANPFGLS
jgi:hypothetical protein